MMKSIWKTLKLLRKKWFRTLFMLGAAGAAGFFVREIVEESRLLADADRDVVGSVQWEKEQKRRARDQEKAEAKEEKELAAKEAAIQKEREKKYERL